LDLEGLLESLFLFGRPLAGGRFFSPFCQGILFITLIGQPIGKTESFFPPVGVDESMDGISGQSRRERLKSWLITGNLFRISQREVQSLFDRMELSTREGMTPCHSGA